MKSDASVDPAQRLGPLRVFTGGKYEAFDRERITASLVKEARISESLASDIVDVVQDRITGSRCTTITARMIREMALSVLVERGMMAEYNSYSTIGLPVYDIEKLILQGDKDNANVSFNPQATMGRISDKVLAEHTLRCVLPPDLSRGEYDREYHIKDTHFFSLGMFCQAWDPRMILRFGLPPTRTLAAYKYSHPTKKMHVACYHLANWFSYAQSVFSGGQGYMAFNTILAPYARGLSDYEIKDAVEGFVFQVNQQRDSRGHQLPFTSIDLNLGTDPNYKDCHAVYAGNLLDRTYDDYDEEAARIVSALCDVYYNGDGNHTPFSFAKFEIRVSEEKIEQYPEIWKKIMELTAHNGTPYFLNGNLIPESAHSQCCRIIFNPDHSVSKYCVDPEKFKPTDDNFPNMGSAQTITINLPRLALDARNDEGVVYDLMDERFERMLEILKMKREIVLQNMERRSPTLCCIDVGWKPIIDMDIQAQNFAHVGLNEMIENLLGRKRHLGTDEGHELGKKYLQHMADWCEKESIRNKIMINLWEAPAEQTASRFATYDVKKFGKEIAVQGKINPDDRYLYYTNSNHIPYNYDVPLYRRLELQGDYHSIVKGGVISHVWLGDNVPEADALSSFIRKVFTKTSNYYMTITPTFTLCAGIHGCGTTSRGKLVACPSCGSTEVDLMSRITGYYALLRNWNEGKLQEFDERLNYQI